MQFPSASEKVVHWDMAIGEPRVSWRRRFVKDMLAASVYVGVRIRNMSRKWIETEWGNLHPIPAPPPLGGYPTLSPVQVLK